MKAYDNATKAKDLLLQFQIYAKALSQRGPTDLSLYLENFAAKLMEIYYGYPFVNMNYVSKNNPGIDLLNKANDHGIQFTIQNNSSDKIINSIEKSNAYNKITIFFFNPVCVDVVVRHVKEKKKWKDNVEVISLCDIFSSIEQDATKASLYKDLCELWISGDTGNYTDLIAKINIEMEKRIEANVRSKKYIPDIYIPEISLKKACRTFADPSWATQVLLNKIPTYYMGYCADLIKNTKSQLKDGTEIVFSTDCDATKFLDNVYTDLDIENIINKLNNYIRVTESIRNGIKVFDANHHELTIDERFAKYQNGVSFTIQQDLRLFEYSKKKFYFVVKDAGQGKTNFLCDFGRNVLSKRRIPTIYLNVNELTKNLFNTFQEQISLFGGKTFNESLALIEQYCSVSGKKLIICIDGLNERNNLSDFKNEVLELFRFVDRNDFIKVISTSRNKAYQVYFKDFKSESFGDLIVESVEEDLDHHGRKTEEFRRKIYAKYRKHFNVWCYISSDARNKLTNDTLLLRLFCEVYENNTDAIINDIFLYDLFSNYIKKRASQLLKSGKVKREDDLTALLYKISSKMIDAHNLNEFTYEGFTSEEKDLLDIIVQEDIIIKSSDENGISLFNDRTSFSFTYDEFRDFLLANILLSLNEEKFEKELDAICKDAERYDGVLKYIFIFCKTKKKDRLSYLEENAVFNKIYSENIFSIEDCYLTENDVKIITNALKKPQNKWVYYNVAKRLDITQYRKLSVTDIVSAYIENFIGNNVWEKIFFDPSTPYQEENGILPELLKSKYMDTREEEVYGILLLLCTMSVYSRIKEDYLIWLCEAYESTYIEVLNRIIKEQEKLSYAAQSMLEIGA